jgi:hypothetical protein
MVRHCRLATASGAPLQRGQGDPGSRQAPPLLAGRGAGMLPLDLRRDINLTGFPPQPSPIVGGSGATKKREIAWRKFITLSPGFGRLMSIILAHRPWSSRGSPLGLPLPPCRGWP